VFYGSQISFAARIEPVTPPGTVFGSDAFVARLMLEAPERFSAEYAGELELAKKFGAHPLFAVHWRAPR
jgi:class 3 adenylate cyclase